MIPGEGKPHPLWAVLAEVEVEGGVVPKAVLFALGSFVKDPKWPLKCHPGLAKVARRAGCSRSTAQKAVRDLEEQGLVAISQRVRDKGGHGSHEYTLHIPGTWRGKTSSVREPDTGSRTPGDGHREPDTGRRAPGAGHEVVVQKKCQVQEVKATENPPALTPPPTPTGHTVRSLEEPTEGRVLAYLSEYPDVSLATLRRQLGDKLSAEYDYEFSGPVAEALRRLVEADRVRVWREPPYRVKRYRSVAPSENGGTALIQKPRGDG